MINEMSLSMLAMTAGAGLAAGAVASLVAEHLPDALVRGWRGEARAVLELDGSAMTEAPTRFTDPIHHNCGHCDGRQPLLASIPILSWVLPNRCPEGHPTTPGQRWERVGLEVISLVMVFGVISLQGATWAAAAVAGACLLLVALTAIDVRTYLLPDSLTLPLLWAGLLFHWYFHPEQLPDAVIGAMLGYLLLWGIYWAFRLATGRHAMGYGDFKLLAALGAWTGWQTLPAILLIAAVAGALIGVIAQRLTPALRDHPIPFGPFLAIGGWASLIGGDEITALLQAIYFPG